MNPVTVVTHGDGERLRTLLIAALLPGLVLADEKPPKCDAHRVGEFWPKPENGNIGQLAHDGNLQVCARTSTWRYRWEYLTVSVDQLKAEQKGRHTHPSNNSDKTGKSGT